MRVPGGGASCLGVGRPGSCALPPPTAHPFRACGRGPLATGCGCGGGGREDPSPTPQRARLPAGFARCGGGMRVPGGGASCLVVGRPGSGALPTRTARPFRACGRGPLPTGCGWGGCGRWDPSPTAQRALLRAGFARCGGGMRVPGGGASFFFFFFVIQVQSHSCSVLRRPAQYTLSHPHPQVKGQQVGRLGSRRRRDDAR